MTEGVFNPNWVSAPGDTITDILVERNLTELQLAEWLGYPHDHIRDLLQGRLMITIDTAQKLQSVLGGSPAFWMIRESQYREGLARMTGKEMSAQSAEWLKSLPLKDMVKFGWLKAFRNPMNQVEECLRFFGVESVEAWHQKYVNGPQLAAFRKSPSFHSEPGAVAAWLKQAEIESSTIDCQSWDAKRFHTVLSELRPLTRKKDPTLFLKELKTLCAQCGIAVVVVRSPQGCRVSGATRFLSNQKALLALSFRYLSDDHFWFTFFHEAGHLLLHSKKALFLEGMNLTTKEEAEANTFAAEVLIPEAFKSELLSLRGHSMEIIKFARRVGVSAGIVVGQLQHLGRLKPHQLNHLKRRFQWVRD